VSTRIHKCINWSLHTNKTLELNHLLGIGIFQNLLDRFALALEVLDRLLKLLDVLLVLVLLYHLL
jgi:hypothetical protein